MRVFVFLISINSIINYIFCIDVLIISIIIAVLLIFQWWYGYPILENTMHVPFLYAVFENNNHS